MKQWLYAKLKMIILVLGLGVLPTTALSVLESSPDESVQDFDFKTPPYFLMDHDEVRSLKGQVADDYLALIAREVKGFSPTSSYSLHSLQEARKTKGEWMKVMRTVYRLCTAPGPQTRCRGLVEGRNLVLESLSSRNPVTNSKGLGLDSGQGAAR